MTDLVNLSASQLSTFDENYDGGCQRKWAFKYIARLETPSGAAAALGTEVDDEQIQPYLRDGRPFDFSRSSGSGYVAEAMRVHLPAPKTVELQKEILLPSPSWRTHGFQYKGFADFWTPDSRAFPHIASLGLDGVPGVGDTKTSVDIDRWGKNPKTLATDVQAMLYATAALFTFRGAKAVDLVWIYGQTRPKESKNRKAKTVHLRVYPGHVAEQFRIIDERARRLYETRTTMLATPDANPLDLPANPESCETFGGCPFRDKCNLGPGQLIEAYAAREEARERASNTEVSKEEVPMSNALAALQARRAAALGQAPPAAAPPLGINPPEAALPPAPPVGAPPVPPPAPAGATGAAGPVGPVGKPGPKGKANTPQTSDVVKVAWHAGNGTFTCETTVRDGETSAEAMKRALAACQEAAA